MLSDQIKTKIAHLLDQEIRSQKTHGLGGLTLGEAKCLAQLAEQKARAMAVPVVISIADQHGQQILFHRMENALPASAQLASDKAYSAAAFRMETARLGALAQPGQMLFGLQANNDGRVILFGGGIPCKRGGVVIGAIGVSGGSADEDVEIARSALQQFTKNTGLNPEEGQGHE